MSLYDRIIAEDARRVPSRKRKWGTGPMSRRDIMSPKARRLAAKALRKAGVHPTKSSPKAVSKVLGKDPAFQSHVAGQQIRRMTTRGGEQPKPKPKRATKPGYKMVFGRWVKVRSA